MVFVIAEAGVNHQGDPAIAARLVKAAAVAGANAVKFQTFDADRLDPPGARREALRELQLSYDAHISLSAYARTCRIEFMSTPFDPDALRFLVEQVGVQRIKIASGQLDNEPLLRAARASGRRILLSTGMAGHAEIAAALEIVGTGRTTLLHCTSAYPCSAEDANLAALARLRADFGGEVGFSDHTEGIEAALAATALGAIVIEKHLTLDRGMEGPDHKASIEPEEFCRMVVGIRRIESMMGDGDKRPRPCEAPARAVASERRAWRERRAA